MRGFLIGAATLALACGPASPGVSEAPAPKANSVSRELVRTAETVSLQPLKLPRGRAEMVASVVDIPPGGTTTIHQHPWSRFVYVERGTIRVTNFDKQDRLDFKAGQVFAEVVAQWHQGQAGPDGVHLVVIDLVPPGVTNMKMR
ncbi:MAG TPA: cupin domain-containing protein [Sphingomicrobium sp.]|nr:cupin domain-containing protein [Sphingomicrobium sp.]